MLFELLLYLADALVKLAALAARCSLSRLAPSGCC